MRGASGKRDPALRAVLLSVRFIPLSLEISIYEGWWATGWLCFPLPGQGSAGVAVRGRGQRGCGRCAERERTDSALGQLRARAAHAAVRGGRGRDRGGHGAGRELRELL